ncbi:MAG: type III secretion protein C [Glomeribacter sp. 1016415]|nr:type III secretion protein C [Glomeribacter sp. 1016415]
MSPRLSCRLARYAFCALLLGVVADATAALPANGMAPFFLATRGAPLAQVLREFGAHYNMSVIVSPQVDAAFIGSLHDLAPEQVLDRLAQLYQLTWYYDGQTLYVYKAQEIRSQLITPAYLPVQTLMTQLRGIGLLDARQCRVRVVPASNAMEVSGVPVCVERVAQFAQRIDEQKLNDEQNREGIQFFPLKYATAADTQYSYRTQQVQLPGVVSILKEMAQGRALPLTESQGPAPSNDRLTPTFSADERQNAVIVRDRKINLPLYADLIAQLDHRPRLVEISVAIIDVNARDLSQLGVDWSASARIGGGSVSLNSGGAPTSGSFSSVISNTGNFMVHLNALEQNEKAQILSRPSIVTLNNLQAVLDRNITFYTKVVSEKSAQLDSISTGSLLRVTPRLVGEGAQSEVMLSLSLQDGRQIVGLSKEEPLPQTMNSEITTQTLLKAGQSLLLGGFIQDELSESARKIPLLGDIPVLGKLFSTTQKSQRHTVRLFLIQADPQRDN